jgi:hypothetical protein
MPTQAGPDLFFQGNQFSLLEVVPRDLTVSSFRVAATPAGTYPLIGVTATVRAQLYTGSTNAGLTALPGATCTFELDTLPSIGTPYGCTASGSAQLSAGQVAVVLFTMTTGTNAAQPLAKTISLHVSTGVVAS